MQLVENQKIKKMKTRILSIAIILVSILGITNAGFAASSNAAIVTTLTDISSVNKIEVHGNVVVFISNGDAKNVKVYNQYYGESALVQNHNGVLRISSYKAEKLVVWVTSNEIQSVSAYDNAEVKSVGNLSKIEFYVELHNDSKAVLNLDAYTATVKLGDNAKIELSGSVDEYNLSRNINAVVNNNSLKIVHFYESKLVLPAAKNEDELMGL